jgi:2,3-bisphosphoglycerate-independent phosphoglycerate mutase
MIITADHGNSDVMVYPDGSPHTSHSKAVVPFCVIHPKLKDKQLKKGEGLFALKDVAPTVLHILGIVPPDTFSGKPIFS